MFPVNCIHSIDLVWLFGCQFLRYIEHLFHCEIFCIVDGMQIVWVILHHEYRGLQCRRHKHSPYHRMFITVFCCIFWGLVLPLSHLIIHSMQEWPGFWRHFWFWFGVRIHVIVFNNESVRVLCVYDRSLLRRPGFINVPFWAAWWVCLYNGSPRSFMLLSLRVQRRLTFMSGFPRAFWCSRR